MNELLKIDIDPEKVTAARGPRPVAEIARAIGVTDQQYYQIESGVRGFSRRSLVRFCLYLKVPVEVLCGSVEKKLPSH